MQKHISMLSIIKRRLKIRVLKIIVWIALPWHRLCIGFSLMCPDPYWAFERHYIDDGYQSIDIPFDELKAPLFSDEKHWDLADLAGYLGTWSSVQNYKNQLHEDPVITFIEKKVLPVWGNPKEKKVFVFAFPMRIFRKVKD